MDPSIIVAIIGAIATLGAAWLSKRSRKKQPEGQPAKDTVTRVASITAAGISLTIAIMVVLLVFGGFPQPTKPPRGIRDFPTSPVIASIEQLKKMDADAKAILEGAGPRQVTVNGRVWSVGELVYVDRWEWVEPVFPTRQRAGYTSGEKCGIEAGAKLTIKGFDSEGKLALIEYTAPGPSPGTSCQTGSFFFYPL